MPSAALQECRRPLCGNFAERGGFCAEHACEAAQSFIFDKSLTPANKRFRWMRKAFLSAHPICNMCEHESASVLDHIIPHRGSRELFWCTGNRQGLCTPKDRPPQRGLRHQRSRQYDASR
jgi:5-methylcytosine-specific restriction protein A